ncbi:MAG: hypothetical protein ACMUEL_01555 [Flavobacteriales bacterium Tduv]
MVRSTAKLSFSELYMERFTRRLNFSKSLKTLIYLESMEKEIRKYIKKARE